MYSPPVLEAIFMEIEIPGSGPMLIPAGSSLPGFSNEEGTLDLEGRIFQVNRVFDQESLHQKQVVVTLAEKFINAPYLWGGRSVFGFDCSGYVQVVFKILGVTLHRDASQQALQGDAVSGLSEILPGDLVFFTGDTGLVNHVGIALSPGTIIHCSGLVRKDKLDEQGIYHAGLQQYTHQLSHLRRVI
jgi:cell wall-associated NlpC family hydrolase